MKTTITFDLDTDRLQSYTDQHITALWHISQANPAPFGDRDACAFAEYVAREIVRRFLAATAPDLWVHQGQHIAPHAPAPQPIQRPMHEQITQLLQDGSLQPGGFYTMAGLMALLGIAMPSSATQEAELRDVLDRMGFSRTKAQEGFVRKWGFRVPGLAPQGPEAPGAPLAEHDTPPSPCNALPPLQSSPGYPQPETRPQAEQPAQTALHQSLSSSPPLADVKDESLAVQGGAA